MASIIIILQLVLSLLSNPVTANSTSTQALASQAIGLATQALTQQQTPVQNGDSTLTFNVPTSTDNTQPIVINVTNPTVQTQPTPVASQPVLGAAPASCTLSVKAVCRKPGSPQCTGNPFTEETPSFTWSSAGISNSTMGQISYVVPADEKNPEITYSEASINSPSGTVLGSRNDVGGESTHAYNLKFLDGTTCSTLWMGVNPDGSQFVPCSDLQCQSNSCSDPKFACQN